MQLGVDTLALRRRPDGAVEIYRLVLKAGPVGIRQWGQGASRGSLIHDLHLAASKHLAREAEDHGVKHEEVARVVVVAVHNGDFDLEALAGQRAQLRENLLKTYGVELEWWDAERLVEMALSALSVGESRSDLFPPAVRPFARVALDYVSASGADGADAVGSVTRFVDALLPPDKKPRVLEDPLAQTSIDEPHSALELLRLANESEIFAEMMIVQSDARGSGCAFGSLDAIELVLLRLMDHLRRLLKPSGLKTRLRKTIGSLIDKYVQVIEAMCSRLEPVLVGDTSLALPSGAEPIDYPLRVLRIAGYLAVGGLSLLRVRRQSARAVRIANVVERLWLTNRPAVEGPILDENLVELALVWEFLLRLNRTRVVGDMASGLLDRCLLRRAVGWPLPALYQSVGATDGSRRARDVRDLVEGFLGGRGELIEDEGSTIIPLALYLASKCGDVDDTVMRRLQAHESGKQCVLQVWQCRADAPHEWYAKNVSGGGGTRVFEYVPPEVAKSGVPGASGIGEFARQFDEFAKAPETSAAEEWGFPVVDRMAFRAFRIRPPMRLFVELLADT
ncbi:MAG: hypothetical protein R3B89_07920 [Polyangiaceae bacterium]